MKACLIKESETENAVLHIEVVENLGFLFVKVQRDRTKSLPSARIRVSDLENVSATEFRLHQIEVVNREPTRDHFCVVFSKANDLDDMVIDELLWIVWLGVVDNLDFEPHRVFRSFVKASSLERSNTQYWTWRDTSGQSPEADSARISAPT